MSEPFPPNEPSATNLAKSTDLGVLSGAYSQFMQAIERTTGFRFDEESRRNTPARVSRMMLELICGKEQALSEVREALSKVFEAKTPEMISYDDMRMVSLCPHHLAVVSYNASIAYIPNNTVVGASKFTRVARALARRPVLQETLTNDIADEIVKALNPKGVGVLLRGSHSCMTARGIKDRKASMTTCAVRGIFLTDPSVKSEWFELIHQARQPR